MVEAMGRSTPCPHKKSHGIRTEKIDFVLTQICDITSYPVMIRLQPDHAKVCFPNLPLLRRKSFSGLAVLAWHRRPSPAVIHLGGLIGTRVKSSRSNWYQGSNMTYHLQKQDKRPLDRINWKVLGKNAVRSVLYRPITMSSGDLGFRKTVPVAGRITDVIHLLGSLRLTIERQNLRRIPDLGAGFI
jgi:hypothetical protein